MFDPKTRILIVDDMLTMRKIVGKVCKELGYSSITEACDGNQAWETLSTATLPFGLVISDWNMPNCTGLDFLKKVRSDERFKSLPFLMVTAEAEAHQVADAIKSGVDNYVVKPFSKEMLKTKLESVYKKYNK